MPASDSIVGAASVSASGSVVAAGGVVELVVELVVGTDVATSAVVGEAGGEGGVDGVDGADPDGADPDAAGVGGGADTVAAALVEGGLEVASLPPHPTASRITEAANAARVTVGIPGP